MNEYDNVLIEKTARTPYVHFDNSAGEMVLSGISIPENASKIYDPLLDWIKEYVKSPQTETNFRLKLDYYNSASLLWLIKIIRALSRIDRDDHILFIHIYVAAEDYDDMEMEEVKHFVSLMVDNLDDSTMSIVIKAYGTDKSGNIVRESTIYF